MEKFKFKKPKLSDNTKMIMKNVAQFSAKKLTPNTAKMFEDVSKLRKHQFDVPTGKEFKSYNDKNNSIYNKSYKQFVNKSLNSFNEDEVDGQLRESEEESFDDDLNLFKDDSSSFNESSLNEPFFNENSSAKANKTVNMRTITNNVTINKKNDKIGAYTNKILIKGFESVLESNNRSTNAILHNINIINKFNENTMVDFFNDTSEKLAHIGNSLDAMASIYTDIEENKFKSNRDNLIDSIRGNGLSIAHLASIFESNKEQTFSYISEIFSGENKSNDKGLKGKIQNKVQDYKDEQSLFGKITEKFENVYNSIKGFDDIIGSMPANLQYSLNKMKKGSKFKKTIFGTEVDFGKLAGKAFGMDNKVRKDNGAKKFEKGPIAYNGIANRAIVNVIPSLLSKILSAVSDNPVYKDELIYDYEKGTFSNKSAVREERNNRVKDTVTKNMMGNINAILGENSSKEDIELLKKALFNMAEQGKTVSDFEGSITGNKDVDKKLRDYYSVGKNKNSFNKNMFNTTMDMQNFYNEMRNDIAGQMAGDFDANPYKYDRLKAKKDAVYNNREYLEREEFLGSTQGKFGSKLNSKFGKLFDILDSGGNVTLKDLKDKSDNPVYSKVETRNSNVNNSNKQNSFNKIDEILNTFKSVITGTAVNVLIKGGSIDGINETISTEKVEQENLNASYLKEKERIANENSGDDEDRTKTAEAHARRKEAQDKRIDAFKDRREKLIKELDEQKAKAKEKWNNSSLGRKFNATKNKVENEIKDKALKSKLGQKVANSKLGKLGKKFGLGEILKSPEAVREQGMTPVYVLGSALANNAPLGLPGPASEEGLGLDDLKNRIVGGGKNILGSIGKLGGKLSQKGGKLGKLGGVISGLTDKGTSKLDILENMSTDEIGSNISNKAKSRLNRGKEAFNGIKNRFKGQQQEGIIVENADGSRVGGKSIINSKIESMKFTMNEKREHLKDKARSASDKGKEAFNGIKDRVKERQEGSKIKDKVKGASSKGKEALGGIKDKIKERREARANRPIVENADGSKVSRYKPLIDCKIEAMKFTMAEKRELMKDKMEIAREKMKDVWAKKGEAFKFAKEKAGTLKREAMKLTGEGTRETIRNTSTNALESVKSAMEVSTETKKGLMNISGEGVREGIRTAGTTALTAVKSAIGTATSIGSGLIEMAGSGIKSLATAVSGIPFAGPALAIAGVLGGVGLITALIATMSKSVEASANGGKPTSPKLDIGSLFSGGKEEEKEAEKDKKEDKKAKKEEKKKNSLATLLTKKKDKKKQSTATKKDSGDDVKQGKLTIAEVWKKRNNILSLLSNQYRLIF